jgi:hypothetical protein
METDAAAVVAIGRPALGIYNHTSPGVRDAALQAGFALAVPRSRFVREAGALVGSLEEPEGARPPRVPPPGD